MAKKIFRQFIIGLFVISSVSCGHSPLRTERPSSNSHLQFEDLDQTQSFGFIHDSNEHYFALVDVRNKEHLCRYFVGFKNGKFDSSFPLDRLKELNEIYHRKLTVEEKKSQALTLIGQFEKESRICNAEIARRQMTALEMIEGGIYVVLLLPIALLAAVTFAAEDNIKLIKDTFLMKRMNQVHLGMKMSEIEPLLQRPLVKNRLPHYEYFFVDGTRTRLAMHFEKDQLTAFVRGYRYSTPHEGTNVIGK